MTVTARPPDLFIDKSALDINTKAPVDPHWFRIGEFEAGDFQRDVVRTYNDILKHPTVYACLTLRANDVSKLPLHLEERQETPAGVVWRRINSRRAIIRKPNSYQTTTEFFRQWMLSLLIYGNAYILIRNNQYFVLDGWRVQPRVTTQGELVYYIPSDDLIGINLPMVIPASQIIHDKINPLFHELCGVSPLYAVVLSASQSLTAQENSTQFFANGARPSGILSVPKKMTQEEADRLQERWERAYSGANQGRVAVLSGEVKYDKIGDSASDAQMVEQLELSTQVICEAFHVPPVKLGIEAPNNDSIEALNLQYYTNAIQADLSRIEKLLADKISISPTQRFRFDESELLRMDQESQVKVIHDGVKAGVMAPNEGRQRWNLPPVSGGETPFLQEQNFPISDLANDHPKLRQLQAQSEQRAAQDRQQAENDNERRVAAFAAQLAKELS